MKRKPYQPQLREDNLPVVAKFFSAGITFGPTELIAISKGQAKTVWKARSQEFEAQGLTFNDLQALQKDLQADLVVIPKHASNLSFFTLPNGQQLTFVTSSYKLTKLFSYLK